MILVIGGAASGKSEFAEKLALSKGRQEPLVPLLYLATMIPSDAECKARIARHQRMRAEKSFQTLECPLHLAKLTLPQGSCVLLECLSNLLANELYQTDGAGEAAGLQIWEGISALTKQAGEVIIVSNAVFSDGICYDPCTQIYLDQLGKLHHQISEQAEQVIEVVAGIPIYHKGKRGDAA